MSASTRLPAVLAAIAFLAAAAPAAAESYGTPEQIAWVRRAATNFISAELNADGAGACAILEARLRVPVRHRTCAQRWDAKLTAMLRRRGERARLRSERRAIASAAVTVHGDRAAIALPAALDGDSANRFLWTENCWMLTG